MWINIDLKKIVFLFLAIAIPMWLITAIVTYFDDNPAYEVKFDCRQAEERMDYPIEVREKCRKVMQKINARKS